MQILLSCAKTMATHSDIQTPDTTIPAYLHEAQELALQLNELSVEEIEKLLNVNRQIASENKLRYQQFHDEATPALPALLAYTGIVFKHLNADDFTADDFRYAQEHLNITSFLYGLLRPLDIIKNYRLEGNVSLPDNNGISMFRFWHERLTEAFINKIKEDDGILVNLASDEMKKLFDWKRISKEITIITPDFRTYKNNKLKTIVIYTKMCRGEMTRYILKNRIENIEEIKLFEWEGFKWNQELSKGNNWLFTV